MGDGNVTLFSQPLKPGYLPIPDIRLHSYGVENKDETVTLVGALAPTEEHVSQISELPGRVRDIVVPSTSPEHFLFAPALSERFPEANLWVIPGFMKGAGVPLPGRSLLSRGPSERGVIREIGVDEGFPAGLDCAVFSVKLFAEAAVYIKSAKAVVFSDLALKMDTKGDPEYRNVNEFLARQAGIYDEVGAITKVVLEEYKDEARVFFDAVGRFDYEHLLLSHATPVVQGTGREELERAMAFLRDE